jgi:hypothetical protein
VTQISDDEITDSSLSPTVKATGGVAWLLNVGGSIDLDTDAVTFKLATEWKVDLATLTARQIATIVALTPEPGDYQVQLWDSDREVLSSVDFELSIPVADRPAGVGEVPKVISGIFWVPVPKPTKWIATIAVLHNGSTIGTVNASPNVPTARIVRPIGGENFTDPTITFEWAGDDVDGDQLFYTVTYFGGRGADNLLLQGTDTTITVDLDSLSGSATARIKVDVYDGINSSSVMSNTFSVPNSPPLVSIEEYPEQSIPPEGLDVFEENIVVLQGEVYAKNLTPLKGFSLSWSSDLDGDLDSLNFESGKYLGVETSALSEGSHRITMTATDSEGTQASTSVIVHVRR